MLELTEHSGWNLNSIAYYHVFLYSVTEIEINTLHFVSGEAPNCLLFQLIWAVIKELQVITKKSS